MSSVIWGLRADNAAFLARYSKAPGGLVPAILGGSNKPTYDVDNTTIGGHCINMDNGSNSNRALTYPGRGIFSTGPFSVLMRIKIGAASTSMGLIEWAPGPSFVSDKFNFFFSGANTRVILANETNNNNNALTLSSVAQTINTWFDYVVTFDGTANAGGVAGYIDGSSIGTATAQGAATSPRDPLKTDYISIGGVDNLFTTRIKIEEVVIWDYVITPTSVVLDSGTASLNGASRTSLVAVSKLSGGSYSRGRVVNA